MKRVSDDWYETDTNVNKKTKPFNQYGLKEKEKATRIQIVSNPLHIVANRAKFGASYS